MPNILQMRSEKVALVARLFYLLVGISALYFAYQLFFLNMISRFSNIFDWISGISLLIGGINWLIVAAFGDRMSDLFGLLGM